MNMTANIRMPRQPQPSTPAINAWSVTGLGIAAAAMLVMLYLGWTLYRQPQPLALPVQQGTVEQQTAALKALDAGQRQELLAGQRARLAANPLDREAIFNLSLLQAAEGNAGAAESLILAAAARSARDVRIQASALDILLKRGEVARALTVMDGLIRSRPALQDTLFDQLLILARSREGEPHVISLFAADPPWRNAFFARAVSGKADVQSVYRLLTALKGSATPAADSEVRLLLGRLVKDAKFATAYYIWLDLLDDLDLRKVANVFDGGFDATPRNLYFDWTLTRSKTAEVKIVPRATGSADKVLRVDYVNNRAAINPALQMLRLQPDNYVLSGEQRADGLKSESGILWQLTCLEGNGGVIARTPKLTGDAQWSRFDIRFSVPADCTTQMLYLGAATSAVLDQQISGSAQFDGFAITPLAANP